MKRIIASILLMAGLPGAFAQGTFQFTANLNGQNEVPPNDSPYHAFGTFSLVGGVLTYDIGTSFSTMNEIFYPTNAGFFGPAAAGQDGPLIFDLGDFQPVINPPPGSLGGFSYSGTFSLTSQQMSDLQDGLWYVNLLTSDYPAGAVRGQVLLVPEPSAWALMIVGGGLFVWFRRKRNERNG
jgi:hypothetical protein